MASSVVEKRRRRPCDLYIRLSCSLGDAAFATPMKWLALLLVAFLGVAAYHAHVQSLKEAQEKAELIAYNQTNSQIERERAARELRFERLGQGHLRSNRFACRCRRPSICRSP